MINKSLVLLVVRRTNVTLHDILYQTLLNEERKFNENKSKSLRAI